MNEIIDEGYLPIIDEEKDYYESEILNEGTIYKSNKMTIVCSVQPGRNYGEENDQLYFKLYNSKSKTSATKMCRIMIGSPNYVDHKNSDRDGGKKDWKLNGSEKKALMKILASVNDDGETIWNCTIDDLQERMNSEKKINLTKYKNKIPDYTKLE